MKTIYIVLIAVILGGIMGFKPEDTAVQWYEWNEGYAMAEKKDKLVLVDLYTDWCGWCKKMDRDTYTNQDIINTINDNFIAIKLNPERTDMTYKIDTLTLRGNQLHYILTNGQRTGFPTTVFVNPKNNSIVFAQPGYQDPENFKKILDKVIANNEK
ncbi:MAG: DUF255 domain-containing protein [Bacteroidota bacterium]|nr:DUF255 domain-containing protein [Bacteroidota bacterium]